MTRPWCCRVVCSALLPAVSSGRDAPSGTPLRLSFPTDPFSWSQASCRPTGSPSTENGPGTPNTRGEVGRGVGRGHELSWQKRRVTALRPLLTRAAGFPRPPVQSTGPKAPPTPALLAPCSRLPLSKGPTPSPGSSEEVSPEQESEDTHGVHGSLEGQGQHRANTTVHVCWYRNTSVSRADQSAAVEVRRPRAPSACAGYRGGGPDRAE